MLIGSVEEFNDEIKHKHPDLLLAEIFDLIEEVGSKNFLHSPKYDSERDLFIACLFVYGVRKLQKREWFIQRNDDPPDFEVVSPTDRPIRDHPVDHAGVELVEIPAHTKDFDEALRILNKKKLSKNYLVPRGCHLLIFFNHHLGPQWSGLLKAKLENSKDNFREVWAIYLLSVTLTDSFTYIVKNLRPSNDEVLVKLKEEAFKGILYTNSLTQKLIRKVKKEKLK